MFFLGWLHLLEKSPSQCASQSTWVGVTACQECNSTQHLKERESKSRAETSHVVIMMIIQVLLHTVVVKLLCRDSSSALPICYQFFKQSKMHTDAKYQFLSKKSILIKSTPTLSLNFPAKNGIIQNLIFWTKIGILPQCERQ